MLCVFEEMFDFWETSVPVVELGYPNIWCIVVPRDVPVITY